MARLMYHDDTCRAFLDKWGSCPVCGYHPDIQALGLKEITDEELTYRLDHGETFLGPHRTPIPAEAPEDT